ncbi:MAG: HD domain-containing protein, partial [Petrimonas sp.]|nr:HD domain-containing protein [Petrimonas sp.]
MKTIPTISFDDDVLLHRRLYGLFRQRWSLQKTGFLKRVWEDSLQRSVDEGSEDLLQGLLFDMKTAVILVDEIGLKYAVVCAVLMFRPLMKGYVTVDEIRKEFGEEVAVIIRGLKKVNDLTEKKSRVESENYIKLLLSIAEDIRVVFILLAEQLQLMRDAKKSTPENRLDLSVESTYLYAPLAHRLGLYTIKSELEDLSLKYTDRETYDFIARKLNESKRSRDKYIEEFIHPLKERLDKTNLKYDIKGRTKSIHSINNKLKKQKIEFDNIYDLFAIRIILDSPSEMEKAHCWQVYSIVTDMYQPNPKRLKDWLSIPKSNGYESLHITVMGPDSKWVEVQIRTRRMDDIAERGLAAHWKYKGIKEESTLDDWLKSLRESLESRDVDIRDKLGDFKLDLYDEEIFVFTPKGDLFKLPKGASVLDFAFAIHSKLGATCVSGKVNG